jgi:hypothetical protein
MESGQGAESTVPMPIAENGIVYFTPAQWLMKMELHSPKF